MTDESINIENLIGKRVILLSNKMGTLRFCGNVSFAPGIWCGIELDEAFGDSDGSICDIRYFTCKKNYGIFRPISEILKDPSSLINLKDLPSESFIIKDDLSENSNLLFRKNTEISDEMFSSQESFYTCPDEFADPYYLSDKDLPCTEYSDGSNSDDSLGILSSEFLIDMTEEMDANLMLDSYQYDKNNTEQDFFFNLNILTENVLPSGDLIKDHVTPALCVAASDEQDTLNLTKVIHSSEKQSILNTTQVVDTSKEQESLNNTQVIDLSEEICNLNITRAIYSPGEKCDLNVTCIFQNDDNKFKAVEEKTTIPKEFSSPKYIVPPDSKSDESSVKKISRSPECSSTPKHETNYTFILDETFSNFEQNFSPIAHLNKTLIRDVEGKVSHQSEEDQENMMCKTDVLQIQAEEKNILNITFNMEKGSEHQYELNKTFHNVSSDIKCAPTAERNDGPTLNDAITLLDEFKNEASYLEENKRNEIKVSSLFDAETHKNVLNTTISLPEEDSKSISANILNSATSVPMELEKIVDLKKKKNECDEKLNITYEKIDQLTELPNIKRASQVPKYVAKETKSTKVSKIARKIYSSPAAASSSKCTAFDKKKVRKSMLFPKRDFDNSEMNKQNSNKRKTLASISSQKDNIPIHGHKSSPDHVKKECPISCTSDSKSLKIKTCSSHENISKYAVKEKTDTESVRSKCKSVKRCAELSNVSSTSSSLKPEICMAKTKEAETKESLKNELNEDMVAFPIADPKKSALKLTKIPSRRSSLPVQARKPSVVGVEEKRVSLVRMPEKPILIRRNAPQVDRGPSVPVMTSKKTFGGKSNIPGVNEANQTAATLKSQIPFSSNKKKDIEEKKKLPVTEIKRSDSPSRRNLR